MFFHLLEGLSCGPVLHRVDGLEGGAQRWLQTIIFISNVGYLKKRWAHCWDSLIFD